MIQKNHFIKLLKGTWELENSGPIVELKDDNQSKILKHPNGTSTDFFLVEEEEGMLLLTIPSVIEKSEVINISPTELVVREFKSGSSESHVRTFRRLEESDDVD